MDEVLREQRDAIGIAAHHARDIKLTVT